MVGTVNQYSQRMAIVQSGWKTQVSLGILAASIVGTCMFLLASSGNYTSEVVQQWIF